jgi:hypothetical protein
MIALLVLSILACTGDGTASPSPPVKQPKTAAEWRAHHLRFGDGIEERGLHFWKASLLTRDRAGAIMSGESPIHDSVERSVAMIRCVASGCFLMQIARDNSIGPWKRVSSMPIDPRIALRMVADMPAVETFK